MTGIRNLSQIDYDKYFTYRSPASMAEEDYTSENTIQLIKSLEKIRTIS